MEVSLRGAELPKIKQSYWGKAFQNKSQHVGNESKVDLR